MREFTELSDNDFFMPRKSANCKFCGMIADRKEIYCSYCGHKIGEDVEDISEPLKPETLFSFDTSCSQCGQERKDTERFCLGCGHDYTVPPAPFMTEEPPVVSFDISKKRWNLKPMEIQLPPTKTNITVENSTKLYISQENSPSYATITGTMNLPNFTQTFTQPQPTFTPTFEDLQVEAQLQAEEDGLIQKPQIEPCEIKPQNEPPIEILKQEAEKAQEEFDENEGLLCFCGCFLCLALPMFCIIFTGLYYALT